MLEYGDYECDQQDCVLRFGYYGVSGFVVGMYQVQYCDEKLQFQCNQCNGGSVLCLLVVYV